MSEVLDFPVWRDRLLHAVRTGEAMEVPCGTCTACCRSSMFIHIEPDEHETRARIPRALLAQAPGRPRGHVVMGFDEHGCCPMLVDGACSIYDHRPRSCRTFDCRVYAAAGLPPGDDGNPLLAEPVGRWPGPAPAVQRAVEFLRAHPGCLPGGRLPPAHAQLAVAALVVSPLFEAGDPEPSDVRSALAG